MKIAVGTLFFGLSVFLNSIELISSQTEKAKPTNLKRLFPQSKGVHFPPIVTMTQADVDAYPEFKILNGHPMVESAATYVGRDDVIFGYDQNDDIKSLNLLFGLRQPLAVFKTGKRKWYTLTFDELVQLGIDRKLRFIQVHDQVHAQLHEANHKQYPNADTEASRVAYNATKIREDTCSVGDLLTPEQSAATIRGRYFEKYNEEFERQKRRPCGGRCTYL